MELTPLVTTSGFLRGLREAHTNSKDDTPVTPPVSSLERMTSMSINPALSIGGKIVVLPLHVAQTNWEGHDATDVAACLAGALLKASNVSLLVSPAVLASSDGLQEAAADLASGLAGELLPKMLPQGGSAAVFVSSMYQGGPKMSARELKTALSKHHASLLKLPSCLQVPEAAAIWVRATIHHMVAMVTGTTNLLDEKLHQYKDEFASMAEAAIVVDEVVNEKHPELCAGIEGSSFRLRFAAFDGSLGVSAPDHIWVYAAVQQADGMCNDAPPA
jgi:hypothetical protein